MCVRKLFRNKGGEVLEYFAGGGSYVEIDGSVCQELDDGTKEHHKNNCELNDNIVRQGGANV